jgi:hypothetical protein
MAKKDSNTKGADSKPHEELVLPAAATVQRDEFSRFNVIGMRKRGFLLGRAGETMNTAFQASYAISGLAEMVRANRIEEGPRQGIFNGQEEDKVLSAITMLAELAGNELCRLADVVDSALAGNIRGLE